MTGTVKSKKDEGEEMFEFNKKSFGDGKKDSDSDQEDEGSNKSEDLSKTRLYTEETRDLVNNYNMSNSASLLSLHLHQLQFSSKTGDDSSWEHSASPEKKMTRHHYIVLITSFLAVTICTGMIGSMSVFYVEFLKDFQESKAKVALVPSLANGIYDIGGLLGSILIDSFGCRKSLIIGSVLISVPPAVSFACHDIVSLIILLGVICAFGSSIVMLCGMVRVGQKFGANHAFGNVVISGSHPAGFLIFPQIMPFLIDHYTWRGTALILAGISLNIIPFGLLATSGMKEEKKVEMVESDKPVEDNCGNNCMKKCPLDFELLKNPRFQLFALTSAFNWGCTYLIHLLIVDFAESRGFSLHEGAFLLTLVGASALVSRLFACFLQRIRAMKNVVWYIIFAVVSAVMHACIPLTQSYTSLVFTVFFTGLNFGWRFCFFVLTLFELVPIEKYPQALGYTLSLWGLSVMASGPIVGKISMIYGNYSFSYVTGGITGIFCLIPLMIYLVYNRGQFQLHMPSCSDHSDIEITPANVN